MSLVVPDRRCPAGRMVRNWDLYASWEDQSQNGKVGYARGSRDEIRSPRYGFPGYCRQDGAAADYVYWFLV